MLTVPTVLFNEAQKIWYYELVIAAVLADGQIKQAEVEYLTDAAKALPVGDAKKQLLAQINSRKPSQLKPPPPFSQHILASIYLEVIEIIICDVELDAQESQFLNELAKLVGITSEAKLVVQAWAEEGLSWHYGRSLLIDGSENKGRVYKILVEDFSPDQKLIYAKLMITTTLLDKQIDEWEKRFVKHAISFVSAEEQRELSICLQGQISPPLVSLDVFEPKCMRLILIELLLLLSGDRQLPPFRQHFFKEVCHLSGCTLDETNKLITWHQRGMAWLKKKDLILRQFEVVSQPL